MNFFAINCASRWFRLQVGLGLLLAVPAAVAAEPKTEWPDDFIIQTWQEEEGLPRNTITSIAQTPDGYLWLGTRFGLLRFDGVHFSTLEGGEIPFELQGQISRMTCDRSGRLWIGTSVRGLVVYERGQFHVVGRTNGLAHTSIQSMCPLPSGNMLIATGGGKVWQITSNLAVEPKMYLAGKRTAVEPSQLVRRQNGEIWFTHKDQYGLVQNGTVTNLGSFHNKTIRICPSHDGGMWLAVADQLLKFAAGATEAPTNCAMLPVQSYDVTAMFEDRSGRLWVGARNLGLLRLQHGELRLVKSSFFTISDLFEDREGNLWMGVESGGLHKIRPMMFRMLDMKHGLLQNSVFSVCQDRDGIGWTTLRNGNLARFGEENLATMCFDITNLNVSAVVPDANGGILAGKKNGNLFHYDTNQVQRFIKSPPLDNREARVLFVDRENRLWVGLGRGGIMRYDDGKFIGPGYFRDQNQNGGWWVTAITQDDKGVLWFGTFFGDLLQFKNERFLSVPISGGLPGNTIGALYASQDGSIWIGTAGSGLGRLRAGKTKFASIKQGLLDNIISQIAEDAAGNFWLGSTRGVFRVQKKQLDLFMDGKCDAIESISYGRADGLANIECPNNFQPSVWKTHDGQIWFATSKGVLQIDPAHLTTNTNPPPLALEEVTVDNAFIPTASAITLDRSHKTIQFKYTALSFRSPEKVFFRRQLVGFDSDWINDGTIRSATYSRLPPGQYEFRFTACNDSGIWNEKPVALAFEVKPAIWQTGWFRLAALVLFAGVVAAVARSVATMRMRAQLKKLEQVHALDRERARIARDLHDDLGARLTQMALLTDLAAAEPAADGEVKAQLQEVSAQARHATRSLDETVWMVNPQKDSLPHLIEYLGHYANEFFRSTPIHCRQHICVNPPECSLPGELRQHVFFAVKEALNNVLKHSGATEVWVRIGVRRPLLRIVIADNGKGFLPADMQDSRHGLANLQHRLQAVGGRCTLRSAPGQGTQLTLLVRLPVEMPKRTNAGAR